MFLRTFSSETDENEKYTEMKTSCYYFYLCYRLEDSPSVQVGRGSQNITSIPLIRAIWINYVRVGDADVLPVYLHISL